MDQIQVKTNLDAIPVIDTAFMEEIAQLCLTPRMYLRKKSMKNSLQLH